MSVSVQDMVVTPTAIDGLVIIDAKAITDERGTVREFFRGTGFAEVGAAVPKPWRQVNLTWTKRGGLRGLHGEAMTKLVGIASGEAFGVYLDARRDSASFGEIVTVTLTVGREVLVPAGVCNGFQAVSEPGCQYLYCFDDEWRPGMAGVAVNPLDPALAIAWPVPVERDDPAMISVKDAGAPLFATLTGTET